MKRRNKLAAGLCALIAAASLAGCGGAALDNNSMPSSVETTAMMKNAVAEDGAYDTGGIYGSVRLENAAAKSENTDVETETGSYRKLIKTVSMDVETENFDELTGKLENRVKDLNGYIENSNVRGNSRYNESRYSSMTIRIPSTELDKFVNEVAEISNITWKSESIEDITLNYVDVESRKKALEVEQERLLTLLEKAENIEDIIAIESRLSDVRYELQSYASQLLVYDNQVEYSTVNLNISEVKRLTPQEEPSMWQRIATGFTDNMGGALKLLENIVVSVLILLPYWGILVALLLIAIVVCKVIYKSQRKKGTGVKKKSEDAKAAGEKEGQENRNTIE